MNINSNHPYAYVTLNTEYIEAPNAVRISCMTAPPTLPSLIEFMILDIIELFPIREPNLP